MALTSPITGAAQTGFTSPTYTLTADKFPGPNGVQYAVTALGGTQTGASSQTADKPFQVSVERPVSIKTQQINAAGVTYSPGRNKHRILVRKGMPAVTGQPPLLATMEIILSVPVGAESVSAAEIRAMISAGIGAATQYSAALGDQVVTGVVTA
jgi:hypothetical protein